MEKGTAQAGFSMRNQIHEELAPAQKAVGGFSVTKGSCPNLPKKGCVLNLKRKTWHDDSKNQAKNGEA